VRLRRSEASFQGIVVRKETHYYDVRVDPKPYELSDHETRRGGEDVGSFGGFAVEIRRAIHHGDWIAWRTAKFADKKCRRWDLIDAASRSCGGSSASYTCSLSLACLLYRVACKPVEWMSACTLQCR
jgi:hypothetical protein